MPYKCFETSTTALNRAMQNIIKQAKNCASVINLFRQLTFRLNLCTHPSYYLSFLSVCIALLKAVVWGTYIVLCFRCSSMAVCESQFISVWVDERRKKKCLTVFVNQCWFFHFIQFYQLGFENHLESLLQIIYTINPFIPISFLAFSYILNSQIYSIFLIYIQVSLLSLWYTLCIQIIYWYFCITNTVSVLSFLLIINEILNISIMVISK